MAEVRRPTNHHMGRRSSSNDYSQPGMYHITLHVAEGMGHPLGRVVGDADQPDDSPSAPHVELSALGRMVEQELLNSIRKYYRMVEVQDYVIMPEHLHFIVEVHEPLVSTNGRKSTLGQVIAGFKKGCNRCYWALTGQEAADTRRGNPAGANSGTYGGADGGTNSGGTNAGGTNAGANGSTNSGGTNAGANGGTNSGSTNAGANGSTNSGANGADVSRPAVFPQGYGYKVPSRLSTGRQVLFSEGYVDVMPLRGGQLAQQRAYIRNNPRSRLLRSTYRDKLQPQRGGIDTALSIKGLMKYLRMVCKPWQLKPETVAGITGRLLTTDTRRGKPADAKTATNASANADANIAANGSTTPGANASAKTDANADANGATPAGTAKTATGGMIDCDSYGNRALLGRQLLPVVCHQNDKGRHAEQKEQCLQAARNGAVLVSARIAPGEQEIMDAAIADGLPVILIIDNGMPELYHPSAERIEQCLADRLLLVTPWKYQYRPADEGISVAECKAMNGVAQALCRLKDDWWKS